MTRVLFLMYIEPLLRWLYVGGRGYQHGCLADSRDETGYLNREVHNLAALGFVDDTSAITGNKEDMVKQARKIEAFSDWAGTPVNAGKCAVTAILHGTAAKHGGSAADQERLARLLESKAAITIGGKAIPFLPPDKPYKYLGVWVCPGMDWTVQLEHTIAAARLKGRQLQASMASPRQACTSSRPASSRRLPMRLASPPTLCMR